MPFRIPDIGRMELKRRKDEEYWTIKKQWETFGAQQEMNFSRWRENKVQISEQRETGVGGGVGVREKGVEWSRKEF